MWLRRWLGLSPPTAASARPPSAARVLAEIRAFGYSREVVESPVCGQSWPALAGLWRVSAAALASEPSAPRRLEIVALRAAVLDEMEQCDPERFPGWLARQHPGRRQRRGDCRGALRE